MPVTEERRILLFLMILFDPETLIAEKNAADEEILQLLIKLSFPPTIIPLPPETVIVFPLQYSLTPSTVMLRQVLESDKS